VNRGWLVVLIALLVIIGIVVVVYGYAHFVSKTLA
jgi:hypothetical protein